MASIETNPLDDSSLEPAPDIRRDITGTAPDISRDAADEAIVRSNAVRERSDTRLERPVHVVTAEHLGWYAIALWAVATRMVALGARPLDPAPARSAMFE